MELNFSRWVAWNERVKLGDILKYPGIYAIAISSNLSGRKFYYSETIRYFGMTNSKTGLKGRLDQFNSVLEDKLGHGGAERFRKDYPSEKEVINLVNNLYVAVCHFECNIKTPSSNDYLVMGDVAKAEYVAIATYLEKFRKLPKYNYKKASPKRPNR